MPTRPTIYFDKAGPENTQVVPLAVRERAEELGIGHVVVASSSGRAARCMQQALEGSPIKLVVVTHHAGYTGGDELELAPEVRRELQAQDVAIVTGTHSLSGVGRAFTSRFGGVTIPEVIGKSVV